MEREKKWRIILTRRNCEQKLVKKFLFREIQSFCPHCNFTSFHSGEAMREKKPLFDSMLFLYIDDAQLKTITDIRNVIRILYWMNSPAEASQKDISLIYNFTNSFSNIQLEKCGINTRLPQTDTMLTEDESRGNVIVRLNSIGFRMIAKKEDIYNRQHGLDILEKNYRQYNLRLNSSFDLATL